MIKGYADVDVETSVGSAPLQPTTVHLTAATQLPLRFRLTRNFQSHVYDLVAKLEFISRPSQTFRTHAQPLLPTSSSFPIPTPRPPVLPLPSPQPRLIFLSKALFIDRAVTRASPDHPATEQVGPSPAWLRNPL